MTCCLMGGGVFWKRNLAQAVRFVIRLMAQPLCSPSPASAGACISRFAGQALFTSGPPARDAKQFHHAAPTRSIHAICCSAALSFQGSGAGRIAAISVIPGWWEAPHSIARSGPSSVRSSGSISGRARSASVKKASPARPAQRRKTPTCGSGSVARYKVIHAASRMIANRRFR